MLAAEHNLPLAKLFQASNAFAVRLIPHGAAVAVAGSGETVAVVIVCWL